MWPLEIKYKKSEKNLYLRFDTGEEFALTAELLRLESPSAEMKGHGGPEARNADTQKNRHKNTHKNMDKKDVGISAIEPVGNYAVRLIFDDGHATGIYSWEYLYQLGKDYRPAQTNDGAMAGSDAAAPPAAAHSCGCGRGSSGSCRN